MAAFIYSWCSGAAVCLRFITTRRRLRVPACTRLEDNRNQMSSLSNRVLFVGLGVSLLCGLVVGQSQTAGPPPEQDQAASQDSTIRVNVDLVNILFTVRAKKGGQLIPNLEKNNFTVYEDNKLQTIERF